MAVEIIRPKLDESRRVIIISDIFGHYETFRRLLKKVRYNREDYLIILGNCIEKGPESLKTLRYIMELSENKRVFVLSGDYDPICKEVFRIDRNRELLQYTLKNRTIIRDMCREQGIPLSPETNMHPIKLALRDYYQDELNFITTCPHIMELPNMILAHAQILPGELTDMKVNEVIRAEAFLEKGFSFEKYVVVGHWPTLRYTEYKRNANPIIHKGRHIICIDGGMERVRDGQLNALIWNPGNGDSPEFASEDDFPKKVALNSQVAGMERNIIQWPDNRVKVLKLSGDMAYCRHESTERNYWIPKQFLSETADGWITEDYTDYQIKVTCDDIVSPVLETSRGTLIKKNGVTGWYYGMLK